MFERLQNSRNALGLGVWLGFTDAKVGRPGEWIGLENYVFLATDSVTQLALFNTLFYTTVASVLKFFLGLWLALLLNRNLRFKSFFRAVILLPYIVPTALSAIAFWWIFDAQFSIISWVLVKTGLIDEYIDFLRQHRTIARQHTGHMIRDREPARMARGKVGARFAHVVAMI